MTRPEPPYEQLDQGIRKLVKLIHEAEFNTTDSGDGRLQGTKEDMECVLPFPHVVCRVDDPLELADEAIRLMALIEANVSPELWNKERDDGMGPLINIEAAYMPRQEVGTIIVSGLDDDGLLPDAPGGSERESDALKAMAAKWQSYFGK